ncbi:MAG: ribose 5-phosphate isomerase B [Desulfobulbaceae bacterium]|nr:ribose 5-phosphate isomerase B [Desulfobulbaceae bacterium]
MKIAIGCDHGGIDLKEAVVKVIKELGHEVDDQGCFSSESVDYPQFAKAVCAKVQAGQSDRGILLCGTGIGMSMVANKFTGIRAALCQEIFSARMSREHNDANVLCMGARIVGLGLAEEVVRTWLTTEFAGGRHQRRIALF